MSACASGTSAASRAIRSTRSWRAGRPSSIAGASATSTGSIPDGESGAQFGARVLAALDDIAATWRGKTVAVVAHGGTLDVAYRHARSLAWDAPREHVMLNAGINRLRAEAGPLRLTIAEWGDVAHLDSARDELAGA
jgi:broad specificity phosphatase PhoE